MKDNEVLSTRLIPYPRARVFDAYADPALLTQWWGANGFMSTFHEFDFREGGQWWFTLHGPDGKNDENNWIFREIVGGERIDLDHISAPLFRMLITLADAAGGTRVTWRMTFESAEVLAGIRHIIAPANEQNFDRLETVLAQD
jgi:uncharacterized protein YndB with AHSA1/START domain